MKTMTLSDVQTLRNNAAMAHGLTLCEQFEDGSIAFTGEKAGTFYFLGFIGRRSRPAAFYRFGTVEKRDTYATSWATDRRAAITSKQEHRAANRKPHSLHAGDVLYSSWGYEQTNIEFYEVVSVRGAAIDMRELKQDRTEQPQGMCGSCTPRLGDYRSDVMAGKRPNGRNAVRITSFSFATPWDGKPLGWSSYA